MEGETTCGGGLHQGGSLDANTRGQRDASDVADRQWPETPTPSNQAGEDRMEREEEENEKKLTVKKVSQILDFG